MRERLKGHDGSPHPYKEGRGGVSKLIDMVSQIRSDIVSACGLRLV